MKQLKVLLYKKTYISWFSYQITQHMLQTCLVFNKNFSKLHHTTKIK